MSICVENVSCVYSKGSPFEKVALEDINLTIEPGEFIGIIGHTGSGKSTLIQHLNGLIHPTSGKVTIDGVDLAAKTKEAVAKRHSVGMVFQYPEHQLLKRPWPRILPSVRRIWAAMRRKRKKGEERHEICGP